MNSLVTENTIFRIFVGTLLFCPLAFGTVEPWSFLIMEAGVFSAFFFFFFSIKKPGKHGILKTPGILPMSALLCYMLFQIIPLPPALIGIISPAAAALYRQSVWIADPGAWAPLSLYPKGTVSEFLRLSSYAAAYLLTTHFLSDSSRFRRTVAILSLFAAAVAFFSIIQHLVSNGKIYWFRELTQGGIPFGPYVNRNHFAGLMGMLLPVVMVRFLLSRPSSGEESLRKKISELLDRSLRNTHLVMGLGAILVALSIFLSLSRGGILSLCVSLLLLGFFLSKRISSRKGRLLLVATVVVILYAVGWFGWTPIFERFRQIRTLQGDISELRIDIWKDSLGIVRDFPITGTGAGSFLHIYPAYRTIRSDKIADHAHNDYIELLADGGIIGLGLFAWFVAAVLRQSYQAFMKRKDPYARNLFAGGLAGVTAFLLHGLTDFNFFVGANGLYFFLLLGLVVNSVNLRENGEEHSLLSTDRYPLKKIIAWVAAGLLLLSILFNCGQILSSILQKEASGISLHKASPDTVAYVSDTLARAAFLDPLEPSHHYLLCLTPAELSDQRNCLSAVRLSPSNAEYLQALGSALEKSGDTAGAGKLFAASVIRAGTDTSIKKQYGSFLLNAGKKEQALTQFRAALTLEPQKVRAYTALLVQEGLSDSEILTTIPEEAEARITFAEYLEATGSEKAALAVYEESANLLRRERPESAGIYWKVAQFAAKKSRTSEALAIMQLAGNRFPKDIGIRQEIAGYYDKLGLKDQAVAAYRTILDLDPENGVAKKRIKEITGETAAKP